MYTNTVLDRRKAFSGKKKHYHIVIPHIEPGTVGVVVAPVSTEKCFFINDLVCSLAAKNVLGLDVIPQACKVTFISAEDPLPVLERQICGLGTLLSPEERRVFADRGDIISLVGQQPSLLAEEWQQWLEVQCTGKRLVILDPLHRFYTAEERDSGAMAWLLEILEDIAHRTQAAIIFTHSSGGFDMDSSEAFRQSSRLRLLN